MKGQIVLLQSFSSRVNFLTSQSRPQTSSPGAPGAPGSQAAAEMWWLSLVSASKRAPPWHHPGHSYSRDVTPGSGAANDAVISQLTQRSGERRDDLDLRGDAWQMSARRQPPRGMISRTNDRQRRRVPGPPAQSVDIQDVLHEHKGRVTQILQQRSRRVSPGRVRQPEVSHDPRLEMWRSVFDFRSLL